MTKVHRSKRGAPLQNQTGYSEVQLFPSPPVPLTVAKQSESNAPTPLSTCQAKSGCSLLD